VYAEGELRTKTNNDMNQGLEIIQEIEDIVSQEKMTPSKCTIVMTKLNLLRTLANSSSDIHNVSDSFHCSTHDCGINRGRKCFKEKCEDWSGR